VPKGAAIREGILYIMDLTELYPESLPYAEHQIKCGNLHVVHVEEHGNPNGTPILYVHGGPGAGIDASCARYFDPEKWRIVLFDQRGCGKSKPFASLEENTTWDLTSDIELIRKTLDIESWVIFGGSWGSTLALAYAQSVPSRCLALILRGIFLGRPQDSSWLYREDGAARLYPDAWQDFLAPIAVEDRGDLITAFHKQLTTGDEETRIAAALAWSIWEGSICQLVSKKETLARYAGDHFAIAFSSIECHYFINKCFFPTDNFLLENMQAIENVPGYIVHGRYDVICPLDQAWELHKAWKASELFIIPDCGHSLAEPGIRSKLIQITDSLSF
jgi:proline iminopeptidase